MFAGLGAARIRRLFREARKAQPAIIFIDELDAVGARRGTDNNSEREQTLNQLLVEMDGFASAARGARRRHGRLQPAGEARPGAAAPRALRPPGLRLAARRQGARADPARAHAPTSRCARTSTCYVVAQQTSGLTGADLANICNEAAIFCGRRQGHAVSREDFDNALERVIAGVQSSTTLNEHERRVVAFHEAGHALCRELLDGVDRVHKISIVPRGSALGYVVNLPDEDSYLKTRDELVDQMTILLGGRVAEQIVFGAVTTGAASDLQRVEEITHAMIHQYAMGSGDAPQAALKDQALSDLTRRIRDEEQRELAFEAHRGAWDAHHHAPRAAGPHRRRAARERDARARADRPHHGGRAAPGAPQAAPRAARRRLGEAGTRPPTRLRRAMFARVDHIGVAVEDLDAAIALHEQAYGMAVAHREVVDEQGVEAVLLDVGENHVELLRPLSAETPVGRFLAKRGPGLHHVAYQVADVEAALASAARARPAAHRRAAAHRHPRLARGLPAPRRVGRRAHRDRPAGGGTLTPWPQRISIGFQASAPLALRVTDEQLAKLNAALGTEGWHELEAEDGSVRLNLAHVLWVRTESDEHRVGFGIASSG